MVEIIKDPKPLSDSEKQDLFIRLKADGIGCMTPEMWRQQTGQNPEQLAEIVKEHCIIHDIRGYLAGGEHIGRHAKMIVIKTPDAGNVFYLVSMKPNVSPAIQ